MIKHIYMTLAALVLLAVAVSAAPANVEYDVVNYNDFEAARKTAAVDNSSAASDEDDDDEVEQKQNESAADDDEEEDDDDDDESFIRRRREAVVEPAKEPTEVEAAPETSAPVEQSAEGVTAIPTAVTVPTTRKPVLVLIRDALKKVTTGLPTEQVANNALQYFQLFEHFIQQAIEQVIDAADDDEEETPAATAEEDKKPTETAETQPEKQTEDSAASPPAQVSVPAPVENETKPAEPEASSNVV
ncbi:hypothetical protein ACLKA7_015194 [Drosophila subpalustris]